MDSFGREPQTMKNLLGDLGRRLGMRGAIETGVLWKRWSEIVGPGIADHAEPTSLKDGVLRVRADSPTWATEIGYLGAEIARKANAAVGQELVTEVRVWTGPGKVPGPGSAGGRGRHEGRSSAATDERRRERPDDPRAALAAAHEAWKRSRSGRRR